MPYKVFSPGLLTSADVDNYLMNQAVIVCTSGTRPTTPVAGMVIYETDSTYYQGYTGAAWVPMVSTSVWTPYTPTLTNFSATVNEARFKMIGKTVHARVFLTLTSVVTGAVLVGVPTGTPVNFNNVDALVGTAWANGSSNAVGMVYVPAGSTNFGFASSAPWAGAVPFTWAAGSTLRFAATYEIV